MQAGWLLENCLSRRTYFSVFFFLIAKINKTCLQICLISSPNVSKNQSSYLKPIIYFSITKHFIKGELFPLISFYVKTWWQIVSLYMTRAMSVKWLEKRWRNIHIYIHIFISIHHKCQRMALVVFRSRRCRYVHTYNRSLLGNAGSVTNA